MEELTKFKIKVFVSSAMAEESGTKWLDIRESIVKKLNQCDFIEPFTIEQHATELKSTEYFQWRASESDIIVILIKDTIRPGTEQEIEIALQTEKPMLVYFFETNTQDTRVRDFKNFLIKNDNVTFKVLQRIENIEEITFTDIINNIVEYYRFTHEQSKQEILNEQELSLITEQTSQDSILNKEVMSYFGDNKNQLIDMFSLSRYSIKNEKQIELNNVSNKVLQWLYNGENFINDAEVEDMFESLPLSEEILPILELRHKARLLYFEQKFEEALNKLDKAYELAIIPGIPDWFVGDILIDSRNIISDINPLNVKYQKKLDELHTSVIFPLGDRFVKQAYAILEKEKFTFETLSENSFRMGNDLLRALQNIENYLYFSLLTGSSTHLLLARKRIIELLIEFGKLYKDEKLLFEALKLIVLAGERKMFQRMITGYWNELNEELAVRYNELWSAAEATYAINSDVMKCVVINTIGQFMDNSLFRKASSFLLGYSVEVIGFSEADLLLEAVNNNIRRIDSGLIIDILMNILKSIKLMNYKKLTNILIQVDISIIEEEEIDGLLEILTTCLEDILDNNGSPFFIINLIEQNEQKFEELYEKMKPKLSINEYNYILIKLGDDNAVENVLFENISTLEKRFESSVKTRVHSVYGDNPVAIINEVLIESPSMKIVDLINGQFVPLIIKVLSSNVALDEKQSYLETLITLLIEYEKGNFEVPIIVKDYFATEEVDLNKKFSFSQASVISSQYYINTIKSILGLDATEDIFNSSIDYQDKKGNERHAFSLSIQKLIEYYLASNKNIPLFIPLVVLGMLRDNYFLVRKNAIMCLMLIYKADPSELLERELIKLTIDKAPNVKSHFATLLGDRIINDSLAIDLLKLLANDASFNVKASSIKMLNKIN